MQNFSHFQGKSSQSFRIVGYNAIHTQVYQTAHFFLVIKSPADNFYILGCSLDVGVSNPKIQS